MQAVRFCQKRLPSLERRQSHPHIQAAHQRGRGTYGAHKIQTELQASGISAGVNRIKRLRKLHGIRCTHKKKFKATTDSKHALPIAPNLLDRQFNHTSAANQVWLTDITYIPTDEGWLYLAAVKDLHTCELVGWAIESFFGTLKNRSEERRVGKEC